MGDLFNGWPEDGEPMTDRIRILEAEIKRLELELDMSNEPGAADEIERLRVEQAQYEEEIERLQKEVVTLRWGSEQYNRLADYVIPRKNLWVDHDGSHVDSVIREIERLELRVAELELALDFAEGG